MNQTIIKILSDSLIVSASFGILGAFVRAFLDFSRFSVTKKKSEKIYERGVLFYFFSFVLIGAFMGIILDYGWALSVLGGYAGPDVLQFLYNSIDKIKVKSK